IAFNNPERIAFTFDLVVFGTLNSLPGFTTEPPVEALPDVPLVYDADAIDHDDDPLTYRLLAGPADAQIDSGSGVLSWSQPTAGNHLFRIRATDDRGGFDDQIFTTSVNIPHANRPPQFVSEPTLLVIAGETYEYPASAEDPDQDPLAYQLTSGPVPLTLTEHRIEWATTDDDIGVHEVSLVVDDGNGGQATQAWTITVAPDPNNRSPFFVTDPRTEFQLAGEKPTSFGDVSVPEISLNLQPGESIEQAVSVTLPPVHSITNAVDIVFVIDGSESMQGEHDWITRVVPQLHGALGQSGLNDVQYGLMLFGLHGHSTPLAGPAYSDTLAITVGDGLLGNATEFVEAATDYLYIDGGFEDGFEAIDTALDYPLRAEAITHIVLITDEDRDNDNNSLSLGSTLDLLRSENAQMTSVLDIDVRASGGAALAIGPGDAGVFADAVDGYQTVSNASIIQGSGELEYAPLTIANGGWAWDLGDLRNSEVSEQAFSSAFATQMVDSIAAQLGAGLAVESQSPLPTDLVEVLTADFTNAAPGETVTFDVRFNGDHDGHVFDLRFIRPGTGDPIGSIPVSINGDYQYDADAVDPEVDPIHYSIAVGPDGATIDPETGDVSWFPASAGVYPFVLHAEDGRGGQGQQSFDVTVTEFGNNASPSITTTTLPTAIDGYAYQTDLAAIDTDGDALRFSLGAATDVPGLVIDSATGRLTLDSPTESALPRPVEVIVRDGRGGVDVRILDLQIIADASAVNHPPEITSVAPPTDLYPGQQYTYRVTAEDPDADPLTFDELLGAPGVYIDAQTGRLDFMPEELDARSEINAIVRVSDGRGGVDLQAITIEVRQPNLAPVFFPVDNVIVQRPFANDDPTPFLFDSHAIDPEGDVVTHSLTAETQDQGVTVWPYEGYLEWSFDSNDEDAGFDVRVVATDPLGASSTRQFGFGVTTPEIEVDNPPIVNPHATKIHTGIHLPFVYDISGGDIDGQQVLYTLLEGPGGLTVNEFTGRLTWDPGIDDVGDHPVRVELDSGHAVTRVFDVTLCVHRNYRNNPPVILPPAPPETVYGGQQFDFEFFAADPEGQRISWTLLEAPHGAVVHPEAGYFAWTPPEFSTETFDFTIAAFDSEGLMDTLDYSITVVPSTSGPIFRTTPPGRPAATLNHWIYPADAYDPDGGPVTYHVVDGPQGFGVDRVTGHYLFVPQPDQLGIHPVTISAIDDEGVAGFQTFDIEVVDEFLNRAPTIDSLPPLEVAVAENFVYEIIASDPDQDALTYSLLRGPSGLSLTYVNDVPRIEWIVESPEDPQSSLFDCGCSEPDPRLPVDDGLGSVTFTVRAYDPYQEYDEQTFVLSVRPGNLPPVIQRLNGSQATEPLAAQVDAGSSLQVDLYATDPNQDSLTYSTANAPDGLSINGYGRIIWQTDADDLGTHTFDVTVDDGRGGIDTEQVTVIVSPDTTGPTLEIITPTSDPKVDDEYFIRIYSPEELDPDGPIVILNGNEVPVLPPDGLVPIPTDTPGVVNVEVTVKDPIGNPTTDTIDIFVIDPTDTDAPFVDLSSPTWNAILDEPTDLIGTISDTTGLVSYVVDVRGSNGQWQVIASEASTDGTPLDNIVSSAITRIDTTGLANDTYTVRVTATDTGGLTASDSTRVHVESDLKLGNIAISTIDINVPFLNGPLPITRTYNSLGQANRTDRWRSDLSLGQGGWSLSFRGAGGELINPSEDLGLFTGAVPLREGARFQFTHLDGRTESWTFQPQPVDYFVSPPAYTIQWVPDAGTTSRLEVPQEILYKIGGEFSTLNGFGSYAYELMSPRTAFIRVITRSDHTYNLNTRNGAVETFESPDGDVVRFGRDGFVAANGAEVRFEKDPAGRVSAIVDPFGERITYTYDAQGRLASMTDRAGRSEFYQYEENRLTGVF
ncbi:MAG: putative Ig domain-containing protein, partial [Planctomycetota bacterium]